MTDITPRDSMTGVDPDEPSTISEKASHLKEKGAELGRRAIDKIDAGRETVAGKMESVAEGLHRRADDVTTGGSKVTSMAHKAADKLDSAAQYVRDHKTKEMLTDLETIVKNHPGKALLAVLAVGFLAGRALQRD